MSSKKENTAKIEPADNFIQEVLSDEIEGALGEETSGAAESFLMDLQEEALKQEEEVSQPLQLVEEGSATHDEGEEKTQMEVPVVKASTPRSDEKRDQEKTQVARNDKTTVLDEPQAHFSADLEQVSDLPQAGPLQAFKRNPAIDLKNADYIKFAQDKIKSLESEISDLRAEAQELASAGTYFKTLADERELKLKSLEVKLSEAEESAQEEKKILNEALSARETKIEVLQERVEFLEQELDSKYNRLRTRERDLESRLEILKQEQEAVAHSKDNMIMKLKKQNNTLLADLEKLRAHNQKTTDFLQDKEDALRRTVKALKLSLTMLESQNKK